MFPDAGPPSAIGTRLHDNTKENAPALASFERRLGDILRTPMPIDPETGGLDLRCLPLGPDAREMLVRYADSVERSQSYGGDMANLTGTASKSAGQAARIAGVLTLWRDLDTPQVEAADMANAIELARHYLLEALRLAEVANVSAEIDRANQLRRWLIEHWSEPEVLVRDVQGRGPNALRESPKARAALLQLEAHGWLVSAGPRNRGARLQPERGLARRANRSRWPMKPNPCDTCDFRDKWPADTVNVAIVATVAGGSNERKVMMK